MFGWHRTPKQRALLDVYDTPTSSVAQANALRWIADGETVTWEFESWCRGTRGTYTAHRAGDVVTVTRREERV